MTVNILGILISVFMKKFILTLVLFFKVIVFTCFFSTSAVYAATVDGLYSAKIKVTDREKLTFEKALRDALVVVLSKNSPASAQEIRSNPNMAGDLTRGHKYVEQFSYQTIIHNKGEDNENQELFLKVSFPGSVINDFLQRGGFSLWPANRAATLLIPVVKLNGSLSLNDAAVRRQLGMDKAFKDAAFKYGIALAPSHEQNKVPKEYVNAFWNWNLGVIAQSTAKIQKDAVLTIRMAVTSRGVRGGWMLQQADKKVSVDIQAQSTEQFIDKGFAWLARLWSEQDAVNLQLSSNEQLLMVSGINSHAKYMQLMTYLNALDIVGQVYMLQMELDKVTMAIALKADAQAFEKALQRSRHLNVQNSADGATTYQWQ